MKKKYFKEKLVEMYATALSCGSRGEQRTAGEVERALCYVSSISSFLFERQEK